MGERGLKWMRGACVETEGWERETGVRYLDHFGAGIIEAFKHEKRINSWVGILMREWRLRAGAN